MKNNQSKKNKKFMILKNHIVFVEKINKNKQNGFNAKIKLNVEDRVGIIYNAVVL